ncbi:MAG TPA: thymidine phosphorylase [Polyangia bacterium]|jgi:pyrimidine-nucleoside phosphorylase|nr:thymidine phosphorylase [Polyangia bacterium]
MSKRSPVLPVPALIARKRDGGTLTGPEIEAIIAGATSGAIPEYQLAALLMAILFRGMDELELVAWTQAMIDSGDRMELGAIRGRKVDKHSTGGVGDKISLCLAPLVAACGVPVPMMSGRALGHTGGTLDKLESIPGFQTAVPPARFARILARAGLVLAGQSGRLAPADRVLYALRDATGTVESIPLIASSILSKKVAEGADALVMDVKVGRGAFLPERKRARALARTLVNLGKKLGLEVRALLTAMDQPLGLEIGNANELAEAIAVLRGEGPADVRALTLRLGAEMLLLGRAAKTRAEAEAKLERAIASGAGLERFALCVKLHGGDVRVVEDPARLPRAPRELVVLAPRAGVVATIDAGALGRAATVLGAGRLRKEDRVDPGVGLTLGAKEGARVARGDALCTIRYADEARLRAALPQIEGAFIIGGRAAARKRLVLETLG